jgi:hypothetical protein
MSPATQKWACFHCRKSFKKPYFTTLEFYVCPDCQQPMTMMGTAFRAPKIDDLEQWKKAEELLKNGFSFYPNAGARPKRLADLPEFLASKRKLSPGQQLLERFQQPSKPTRARDQGRLKVFLMEGRPVMTLLGKRLHGWETLEFMHQGTWVKGVLRAAGVGNRPTEPRFDLPNGVRVFITPNMTVRFPKA